MKAAIYVRVSTQAQARGMGIGVDAEESEERYSLAIQEDSCVAFCAAQGWDVAEHHIYREAFSARNLDRPRLNELRDAMRKREFDKVVIYKLDRLVRSVNQQGTIFFDAERADVEIVSATNDFQNTVEGEIVRVIVGVVAQQERANIARRTGEGRRRKIEAGHYLGRGRFPYGYTKEGNALVQDENAATVRMMYDLALQGYSSTMIASELIRQRIPTPSGKDANGWASTTVTRLLESTTYKGEVNQYRMKWEKDTVTGKKKQVATSPDTWVTQTAPPIVTAEEWESALQRMKANNKPQWKAHAKDRGTLFTTAQTIVCGHCGQSIMRIDDHRKRRLADGTMKFYDAVPTYLHNPIGATKVGCKRTSIKASTVDEAVWEAVQSIVSEDRLEELLPDSDLESDRLAHDVAIETDKVADCERKLTRARRYFEVFVDGLEDGPYSADDEAEKAEFTLRIREARRALAEAKESLRVAKERQSRHASSHISVEELSAYMAELAPRIRNADLETRRQFLLYLGVQVQLFTTKDEYRAVAVFDNDPSKRFFAMLQDGSTVTDYKTLSRC